MTNQTNPPSPQNPLIPPPFSPKDCEAAAVIMTANYQDGAVDDQLRHPFDTVLEDAATDPFSWTDVAAIKRVAGRMEPSTVVKYGFAEITKTKYSVSHEESRPVYCGIVELKDGRHVFFRLDLECTWRKCIVWVARTQTHLEETVAATGADGGLLGLSLSA